MPEKTVCRECEWPVENDVRFCPNCGAIPEGDDQSNDVADVSTTAEQSAETGVVESPYHHRHPESQPLPVTDAAAGNSLVLVPGPDSSSKNHRRIVLHNSMDEAMSHIVARTGSRVRKLDYLQPGESRFLDVPKESHECSVSGMVDGDRHSYHWDLEEEDSPRSAITFGPASDGNRIRIKATADTPLDLNFGPAGDYRDVDIEVSERKDETQTAKPPFSLVSVEKTQGYPEWALTQGHERLIFFHGRELTLGRSERCTWRVFCRESGGKGILVRVKDRGPTVISEHDLARKDVKFPISRCHAALRWEGGQSLEILDRSRESGGSRGVYHGGVRLDAGWLRFPLPLTVSLGNPDKPHHADIETHIVCRRDGNKALCLRQPDCAVGELVVWQRPGEPFGLARNGAGGWYASWNRAESEMLLTPDGTSWHFEATGRGGSIGALTGTTVLRTSDVSYRPVRIEADMLVLARV